MSIDVAQLQGLGKDELQKLLNEAKKKINEIQQVDQQKKESEYEAELAPYKEKLGQMNEKVAQIGSQFDEQIEELRKKKKEALDEAKSRIDKYMEEYNNFRKGKGLPPASAVTRKRPGTKQHRYDIKWNSDTSIQVVVDDKFTSDEIDISKSVAIKPIKEVFEKAGIQDDTGGRARGVVNRIKKEQGKRTAPVPAAATA